MTAPGVGAVIEVEDLTKTYAGGTRALDGVSFVVEGGEVFGFLGPNGAGKTTTIRILATLLAMSSGRAAVMGRDVRDHPAEVRSHIGYASQAVAIDPMSTGRENVELVGRLHRVPAGELRARVDELLELLGLSEAGRRLAGAYSGGMRRRLDLACALVHRPRVLFLDEPTEGLDPQSRLALWTELARIRAAGTTLFLTTHYMEEADRLCDRIAIVDAGRIVVEGSPAVLKRAIGSDVVALAFVASDPEDLARQQDAVETALEGYEAVLRIDRRPDGIAVSVSEAAPAVPEIVRRLDGNGTRLAALTMAAPTLDDVFVRHTGRRIREEAADAVMTLGWYG